MKRRSWYPALPEIHNVGPTLAALGMEPGKGKTLVRNAHMKGIGKNPGNESSKVSAGGVTLEDCILEPDPSMLLGGAFVFWLRRRYRDGGGVTRNVVFRSNAMPIYDPRFYDVGIREHADYGNDDGPQLWDRVVFVGIPAQCLQRVLANTKAKLNPKTQKYYAERKEEFMTSAELAAGDYGAYWDALKRTGTLEVKDCVAVECGHPLGGSRASFGYSFFPAPWDVHIRGGSYTTVHAPGHDTSDSSPDLDAHSYGGLLVEGKTYFVDVDPVSGKGIGGPKNDGVWQFRREVLVEDWHLNLNDPDRDEILIRDIVSPVVFRGGSIFGGGRMRFENCTGGVLVQGVESDCRLIVDGIDVGPVSGGLSLASKPTP